MRYLDEHPEVADEIEAKIREFFKNSSDYADTVEIGSSSASSQGSGDIDLKDIDDEDLITEIPDDL